MDKDFKKEMEKLGIDIDLSEDVTLNTDAEADILYKVKRRRSWAWLKIFPLVLIGVFSLVVLFTLTKNNIVLEDIAPYSYKIGPITLVSNEYEIPESHIYVGANIIYSEGKVSESFLGPYLFKYGKGKIERISGYRVFVIPEGGTESIQIRQNQILYPMD